MKVAIMSSEVCQLCRNNPATAGSHITSKFVFRAIKDDSPTGYFRNATKPNKRLQDGDKCRLLCNECEQRFGTSENEFAQKAFHPFHKEDCDEFAYGPWLHYFMTSLAWRTLVLDLHGLEEDRENPRAAITQLTTNAELMRQYLLGAKSLASSIRNHAILWTKCDSVSSELAAVRPNVMIRRSVFGYTVVNQFHGYSGILHNLAGFLCFLIVKGNPGDQWNGTKIHPEGGVLKQPQNVNSWLVHEYLTRIVDMAKWESRLSTNQEQIVSSTPQERTRAWRFQEWDQNVVTT